MKKSDLRIGDSIVSRMSGETDSKPSFILVGCPVDEGVTRNGGRPGASKAPPLIRKHLFKMTPPAERSDSFHDLVRNARDLGDMPFTEMEDMQMGLAARIAPWLEKKVPVIVLGGGHETTFGHYLGYRQSKLHHDIINIDAHSDVRPLKNGAGHSGSPFRQILEDSGTFCRSYHVMGLQPQSVTKEHLEYVEGLGGSYLLKEDTSTEKVASRLEALSGEIESRILMTLDMDVLDQSVAPGVSAPCPDGLPKSLLLKTARLAGEHKSVASLDLVEVNPLFDRDEQTARLGALIIWNFIYGLCERRDRGVV